MMKKLSPTGYFLIFVIIGMAVILCDLARL